MCECGRTSRRGRRDLLEFVFLQLQHPRDTSRIDLPKNNCLVKKAFSKSHIEKPTEDLLP